jgi:ABC-type nitrate/sulfonate/bicarbonate transport system substrate-binding protein
MLVPSTASRARRAALLVVLVLAASGCSEGAAPGPPAATGPLAATAEPAASQLPAGLSPTVPASTPTPGALRFRIASTQAAVIAGQLLPYWVGIDAGLFRQEGLGLELVTLQSDQIALTAAANGEVDALVGTPGPALLATIAGGIDAVVLGGTHNAFDQHLIAATDVKAPADMVGRTVIISEKRTLNDFQTREALARLGLDADGDLAGSWTGANQAERVDNLRLGNGQATVVNLPLSALLAREGFTDFGDLSEGPPWPGAAIVVTRRGYAQRNEYLQRFLRGLVASIQRTKADPALAQQALAKYTKIDDPEAVEEAYGVYGQRLLERVPYMSRDGLQRAIDYAAQGRPQVRRLQAATLIDHTMLQRLESSGYVDSLYH